MKVRMERPSSFRLPPHLLPFYIGFALPLLFFLYLRKMRIRRNSEFANRLYSKLDGCVLNQNPWDILDPRIQSKSEQTDGENDDFCGLSSFGSTVKDLLSELFPTEEGKDKTQNELAVYCGMEARARSHYCELHVPLPENSCSGTSKRSAKKVNRKLKRKKPEDSSPGDEILYYAGFPGLRRKRGPRLTGSEAAALHNVEESG